MKRLGEKLFRSFFILHWFATLGLLMPVYMVLLEYRGIRQIYRHNNPAADTTTTYVFHDGYLEEFGDQVYSTVTYGKIREIIETETNFYLMFGDGLGTIIIKQNCSPELIAFIRAIRPVQNVRGRRKRRQSGGIVLTVLRGSMAVLRGILAVLLILLLLSVPRWKVERVTLNPAVSVYAGEEAENEFQKFFTDLQLWYNMKYCGSDGLVLTKNRDHNRLYYLMFHAITYLETIQDNADAPSFCGAYDWELVWFVSGTLAGYVVEINTQPDGRYEVTQDNWEKLGQQIDNLVGYYQAVSEIPAEELMEAGAKSGTEDEEAEIIADINETEEAGAGTDADEKEETFNMEYTTIY